jgi:hypothetical protein
LIVYSCLSRSTLAQEDSLHPSSLLNSSVVHKPDFRMIVLPIVALKFLGSGVEGGFGTGYCLDQECRFIGTNYHTAMVAHPRKIKGQKIVQVYLATGPEDEGATVNEGPSLGPMKYALSRDLAIFELHHPLAHHYGIAFSLDDLQVGQEIDIYAYPKEGINPIRSLLQFHGKFKGQTPTGLLAFDYSLSADKAIRPGASGGVVVDSETQQVVGILNGVARDGEAIALAVPVQSLVDFVSKVQPSLVQSLFPPTTYISPALADFYPKFVPPLPADVLQHRPEEPVEVKVLRSKAQLLADSMRYFIAVQTFAWGSGDKAPAATSAYEIRVLDGYQRFRKYPDGKKELQDVPFPFLNNAITPGGEWSELPEMVGTRLRLKIQQAADVIVNKQRMKVFQYRSDREDALCRFESILDFGFFAVHKIGSVGCYGEVWTDESTNILRMSEHLEISGRWKEYQSVVTYGWLRRTGDAPRLIPLTISTQANLNKRVYWCRGQFTNYMIFSSNVKILAGKLTP